MGPGETQLVHVAGVDLIQRVEAGFLVVEAVGRPVLATVAVVDDVAGIDVSDGVRVRLPGDGAAAP